MKKFKVLFLGLLAIAAALFMAHGNEAEAATTMGAGALALPKSGNPTANAILSGTPGAKLNYVGGDVSDLLTLPPGEDVWSYSIKVTCPASANTIILNKSYDPSSANGVAEGAFSSVGGVAGYSGEGKPRTITAFLAYMQDNPTLCLGFKIKSSDALQMDEEMTLYYRNTPFQAGSASDTISFSNYQGQTDFQDKQLLVKRPFVWDHQTEIQVSMVASATVTFTFFFRGTLNTALALRKYVNRNAIASNFTA